MRKKLDTRFPAARIKKIMQSDEDVGKIAMAVPLLVSKALELFLQDLCDRTYEITLKRGAKTLNSSHLKQCVQTFSVFDFLRDTVGKAPDLGGSDNVSEDCPASVIKRRRVVGDEENDSNIDLKKAQMIEAGHPTSGVRGRGRGRGRPRGRRVLSAERDLAGLNEKTEDNSDGPMPEIGDPDSDGTDGMIAENKLKENPSAPTRNFDLNADLDENGDLKDELDAPPARNLGADTDYEMKHEEIKGWSVEKIAINPMQLAGLNGIMEDDEDYDEES